ncbi:AMP-binding protein [Idiomarina sp. HP20-50]|uniref:AMP-binding protein n=1 Tax=Idiomarina sp. HP20-50 TaxID=3070813 RepID=UPI00294B104F|nr:AMP-binding protein [Idiomarina sp. HP20-50]MDV6316401.1 AMP-binding protein [Idiomarina sp. HP20-50]
MLLEISTDHWELRWPRSETQIAVIGEEPINVTRWLRDVAAATQWLAKSEGNALLYQRNWYRFSVWFFALLNCQKRVILPANDKPATLTELSVHYSFRVPDELPSSVGLDTPEFGLAGQLDAGVTFFTSGSSGKPKAVEKTLRQLWLEVMTLERTFSEQLGSADVVTTVTHQHIYGFLFTVLWPIAAGRSVTIPLIDYPEQLQQILAKAGRQRYALISSPAHLQRLDNLSRLTQYSQSLAMIFSSGGPLPDSVPTAFAENGLMVPTEVYGSTETGGIAWRQRTSGSSDSFTPLAGVNVSCDENGKLVIQSPYLNNAKSSYLTEDKVELEEQGGFQLLGRQDRIAKIAEKRVSLNEVEAFALRHDWVESAKVCVLHSPRVELGLVLVLTPKGNAELNSLGRFKARQELRHHLLQRFDKVVVPKRFRYRQQLPYNDAGKITQADLIALFEKDK